MKILFLIPLLAMFCLSAQALTPLELQGVIDEAKESVDLIPAPEEERFVIAIAVSLSMPQASLKRLGEDARDAHLALSFRGVGKEVVNVPNEKPKTILERYGKGLIARHLEDFKFLTDAGVPVKIDPLLFSRHGIKEVPQILLLPVCQSACEKEGPLFVARGDVTLRYALDFIAREIESELKKKTDDPTLLKAQKRIQEALNRLGDRP